MIQSLNLPRPAREGSRKSADDPMTAAPAVTVEAIEHAEGPVARTIEDKTAKMPSDVFLWAALGTIGTSLALQIAGKKHASLLVGQWAAPLLVLGVYNKIVKVAGSDRIHDRPDTV